MLKLTRQISAVTNIRPEEFKYRVFRQINERRYTSTLIMDNVIGFSGRSSGVVWRNEFARRFKSGRLELFANEKGNAIRFTYTGVPRSAIIGEILISIIFGAIGFTIGANFLIIFAFILFGSQTVFKYFYLQKEAQKMLNEISG